MSVALQTSDGALQELRRAQLLKTAIELIAEQGVHGTTFRSLADRAGVSVGMINYYFKTKKELIGAAIEASGEIFGETLDQQGFAGYGPRRLRAVIRASLSGTGGVPAQFATQYLATALIDEDLREAARANLVRRRASFRRSLIAGKEAGQFNKDLDESLIADLLFALIQGLRLEMSIDPDGTTAARAIDICDLVVETLTQPTVPNSAKDADDEVSGSPLNGALEAAGLLDAFDSKEIVAVLGKIYSWALAAERHPQ